MPRKKIVKSDNHVAEESTPDPIESELEAMNLISDSFKSLDAQSRARVMLWLSSAYPAAPHKNGKADAWLARILSAARSDKHDMNALLEEIVGVGEDGGWEYVGLEPRSPLVK